MLRVFAEQPHTDEGAIFDSTMAYYFFSLTGRRSRYNKLWLSSKTLLLLNILSLPPPLPQDSPYSSRVLNFMRPLGHLKAVFKTMRCADITHSQPPRLPAPHPPEATPIEFSLNHPRRHPLHRPFSRAPARKRAAAAARPLLIHKPCKFSRAAKKFGGGGGVRIAYPES